jgi:hypothetical protein
MRGEWIASAAKQHIASRTTFDGKTIAICGQKVSTLVPVANQPKCRECARRAMRHSANQ